MASRLFRRKLSLFLMTAYLALAVLIPYTRGIDAAEYHFFDIPDLAYRDHSHEAPGFQGSAESHLHTYMHFCLASRISTSKFSTANQPLAIAQKRHALASKQVRLSSRFHHSGLSPPSARRKPISGRSPPMDVLVA
jgi:hypothetical protein